MVIQEKLDAEEEKKKQNEILESSKKNYMKQHKRLRVFHRVIHSLQASVNYKMNGSLHSNIAISSQGF